MKNVPEQRLSLSSYSRLFPLPWPAKGFHHIHVIYIFISAGVCFLFSPCFFKHSATPWHASWVGGQRISIPPRAEETKDRNYPVVEIGGVFRLLPVTDFHSVSWTLWQVLNVLPQRADLLLGYMSGWAN